MFPNISKYPFVFSLPICVTLAAPKLTSCEMSLTSHTRPTLFILDFFIINILCLVFRTNLHISFCPSATINRFLNFLCDVGILLVYCVFFLLPLSMLSSSQGRSTGWASSASSLQWRVLFSFALCHIQRLAFKRKSFRALYDWLNKIQLLLSYLCSHYFFILSK